MTIAVFFGGKSCEHNVSIVTGVQVINSMPKKYRVVPIYITEKGEWLTGKHMEDIANFTDKRIVKKAICGKNVHLEPGCQELKGSNGKRIAFIDCAINCCHGYGGEDGCLQGLLQLSFVPYTGGGVLSSSVGMDKIVMKRLFENAGLAVIEWAEASRTESTDDIKKKISRFGYPVIIKPANLGSSIGIAVVKNEKMLESALSTAFAFDDRAVIERAAVGFKEYNCAVLTSPGKKLILSEIEEPIGWTEFLTYNDKYITKSPTLARRMPASVTPLLKAEIEECAVRAFKAVMCRGVARIDFILDGDKLFVNEINTIPGSLSFYLFKGTHLSEGDVIDRLVIDAISDAQKRDRLTYSYKGDLENLRGKK